MIKSVISPAEKALSFSQQLESQTDQNLPLVLNRIVEFFLDKGVSAHAIYNADQWIFVIIENNFDLAKISSDCEVVKNLTQNDNSKQMIVRGFKARAIYYTMLKDQ